MDFNRPVGPMTGRKPMRFMTKLAMAAAGLAFVAGMAPGIMSAQAQDSFEMKIVHGYPVHTQHGRNMETFKRIAEEKTGGRLKVTLYPNAELGPISQEFNMVMAGTVNATYNLGGILESVDPAAAIWNMPFLMKVAPGQGEHMKRVMESDTVSEILDRRLQQKGLKSLGHIPTLTGFMLVGNNVRPVKSQADMEGLKIRHPGGLMGELYIKSLGGSPMTIAGAEVPVALQQGVVDGLVTTPIHYHDAKWHTKYMTLPFYAGYGLPFVANLEWWQSLPQDLRDTLVNEVIPAVQAQAYEEVIALENSYIEEMQKEPYNVQIDWIAPGDLEVLAAPVREAAIEKFVGAVGEDGQMLVDEVNKLGEGIELDY